MSVPFADQKRLNDGALLVCLAVARETYVDLDTYLSVVDLFRPEPYPKAVLTCTKPLDDPDARSLTSSALIAAVEERIPVLKGRVAVHIPPLTPLVEAEPAQTPLISLDAYNVHDVLTNAVHISLRRALYDVATHLPWLDAGPMVQRALCAEPTGALLRSVCFPNEFQTRLRERIDAFVPQVLNMLKDGPRKIVHRDILADGAGPITSLVNAYERLHRMGTKKWSRESAFVATSVFRA